MILEEQPAKVAEALKLFFQGLGYATVRPRVAPSVMKARSLTNTPVKTRAADAKKTVQPGTDGAQNQDTVAEEGAKTATLLEGLQDLTMTTSPDESSPAVMAPTLNTDNTALIE